MSSAQNKIQKSMENIRATEEMKQNTLQYLETQRAKQGRGIFQWKPYTALRYVMAVICIFLLAGTGGYAVYSRPVSYISIDVNPSIELSVNCFGRVVSVKGYNEDGQDILEHVPLKNISYQQAIDRLLQDAYYIRFLNRDSQLVVTVISEHSDVMLEQINANDSFQALGALTYSSDAACMDEAHQHEMSFGKYRAFLELAQYDASITVEDCHGMTMGEIQDRIRTCQGHGGSNAADSHSTQHTDKHSGSHGHH
ncbi:MAG: hypothetical protein K2I96_02510 [Lachnospiraceae bacterium]|nr:hypothetical protein [Lachnospiraceae bacterium]